MYISAWTYYVMLLTTNTNGEHDFPYWTYKHLIDPGSILKSPTRKTTIQIRLLTIEHVVKLYTRPIIIKQKDSTTLIMPLYPIPKNQ